MKKVLLAVFVSVLFSSYSYSIVRNVPANYATIQSALSACIAGDTVLVQPGTYTENLSWPATNSIKLLSVAGSGLTAISGGGTGRVLAIISALIDTSTQIKGFTFINGYLLTNGNGAGIYVMDASVLFDDILVTGNRIYQPGGHGYGAGVFLDNTATVITNSSVSGNSIDTASWCYGAGVYISGGSPRLNNVYINDNYSNSDSWCYGVGLFARANAEVKLDRIYVAENTSGDNATWYYGNGIYLGNVTATLTNVIVKNNLSGTGAGFNNGGGIFCDGNQGVISMMNVTVAGNDKIGNGVITGSGIYVRDADVTAVNCIFYNPNPGPESEASLNGFLGVTYSNVRGGISGTGNLNVVPGFISSLDFHLWPTSLCAGMGTNIGAPAIDFDGNARPVPLATMPDMGAYETDQSTVSLMDFTTDNKVLNVYPNPVISGQLLSIENAIGNITITDVSGRVIYEGSHNTKRIVIYTQGWNAGIYVIRVPGIKREKFCIIR